MTQQIINIGSAPNDGTGDPARVGGQKINDNFTELYDLQVAYADSFTATAGQTVFTLSANPGSLTRLLVSLDGSTLAPTTDYTWTTPTTLTLTAGAFVGQKLLAQYSTAGTIGVASSSAVQYTQGSAGSVTRTQTSKNQESVSVKDFGAVGDGVTDDTAAIQAALNYAGANNCGIYFPRGTYAISNTLAVGTSTRLYGDSMINTIIKMVSLPAGSKPTYTGSTTYPPTLDYFPVLWNNSPIQWFSIENICINGGGFPVYGLRLQENFYGYLKNVVVTNCAARPYINVRGQNILHENVAFFQNTAGVLTFDNTGLVFQSCGFELLGCATALEVRDPVSTKTGISIRDCWFEDAAGTYNTTASWIRISGRNPVIENAYFSHTGANIAGVQTIGAADGLTFDGISTANAAGAINGRFVVNYAAGTLTTVFSSDSYGCDVKGQFNAASVTDNNGNNTWDNGAVSYPYKIVGSAGFEWGTPSGSFLKLDVANNRVALFGAATYFHNASGNLELIGSLGAQQRIGTDVEIQPTAGHDVYIYDKTGASSATTGRIVLGTTKIFRSTAAPVAGTWAVGDWCINQAPAVGNPKGWRCTVAGSPGTWVSEGNL